MTEPLSESDLDALEKAAHHNYPCFVPIHQDKIYRLIALAREGLAARKERKEDGQRDSGANSDCSDLDSPRGCGDSVPDRVLAEHVAPPPTEGGEFCPHCGANLKAYLEVHELGCPSRPSPAPSPQSDVEKVTTWLTNSCVCGGPENNRGVPCPYCKTAACLQAQAEEIERYRAALERIANTFDGETGLDKIARAALERQT